jgi:hypothetical protein
VQYSDGMWFNTSSPPMDRALAYAVILVAVWRNLARVSEVIAKMAHEIEQSARYSAEEINAAISGGSTLVSLQRFVYGCGSALP